MVADLWDLNKRKLESPSHLSGNRLVTLTFKPFLMTQVQSQSVCLVQVFPAGDLQPSAEA